jgi:hypothetical protein
MAMVWWSQQSHGDENDLLFTSLLQITHPSSEAKRRRWELARPCDMDMIAGEGRVCREEGEMVSHQGFGSTFVVDPEARHGITCHCCFQKSFVLFFISSWNGSWRFILLLSLVESGCKSIADYYYYFLAFRKKTFKSYQRGFHGHDSFLATSNNYHTDS